MKRTDLLMAGGAVASVAAVGSALVTQHVFGILPCAWCVFQRLLFLLVAAGCLIALAWRSPLGRRVGAALALLFAASGAAAALWQHFVAASSTSCDLSLAERVIGALGLDARWPNVFMAMASCADAAVKILGVPFEFYSLALYVVLGLAALQVLRRPG
jgi:protein dithiol:quinone oxidoreductase